MANHKSAIKRHRQSLKRRDSNRSRRAEVRTALKKAATAATAGNETEAKTLAQQAESAMSKATKRGLFHKKTLARKISRLASSISAASKKTK
jgi:small subunit ribosomal protein S20